MIKINNKTYDTIRFNVHMTNQKVKYIGISLAKGYLAVTDSRVYNTLTGKSILRTQFVSNELCLLFAEELERVYKDYFEIWDVCPEADLVVWCRYTVPEGLYVFRLRELLSQVPFVDNNVYNEAKQIATKSVGETAQWTQETHSMNCIAT